MHFIIDKNSREIKHIHPTDPDVQQLEPSMIWSGYDEDLHRPCSCPGRLHDIQGDELKTGDELPDYYTLSEDPISSVTIQTMEELIAGGRLPAPTGFKYVGDERIEKTRAEKIADDELTVEDVRDEKIAAVNALYSSLIARGCIYNNVVYSCSKQARDWLLGQLAVPKDAGWSLPWDSKDKMSEITLDESNLAGFVKHLADHFRTISQIREEKIKLIRRSATIAELDAVDWTGGWALPSTLPAE